MDKGDDVQEVPAPLPVGTVIQGHYLIESLLGQGNFGTVYLVRDQRDKQKLFALAELINPNEQGEYRFTLEYVSPAPLDHRTLPQAQYAFNDDKLGRAYLLMSYIEEPNFEILRLQRPEKRFPLPQVMTLMAPIINAVTYLHQQHPPIIHRDIKPANIIVPRAVGLPVLIALSIIKEHGPTKTAVDYFTPGYAATEQYIGEFSTRTDIYGLGAIFYTLLTGIVPPDALSRSTQLGKGGSDPLKPVNEVFPALPLFIAEAIQRAMSLEAAHRFSSVEQFWEALWFPRRQLSLSRPQGKPSTLLPPPVASTRAVARPAPAPVAEQPPAPDVGKPGAPKQVLEQFAPAPIAEQPPAPNVEKPDALKLALEPSAPVPVTKQPYAPNTWKLSTLWPAAHKRAVEKPVPTSEAKQLRAPHVWKFATLLIVLILLIGLGVSADFSPHRRAHPAIAASATISTPGVRSPTSTPTSLGGTYNGTINDIPAKVRTSLSLTNVRQSQGKISGYLTVGLGLLGYGPFSGTIDTTAKRLQFTVTDDAGNPTLFFEGAIQSPTSLSGDYYRCAPGPGTPCPRAPAGYGIWSVTLA